jgi:hypothetical protein
VTLAGYVAFCAALLVSVAVLALVVAIITQGPPEDE